jgi:hypothetical protein
MNDTSLHPQSISLQKAIAPLRENIINHKVYGVIRSLDDLRVFMQYHVFAVWDFMSLLKSLQKDLTCVSVPWLPLGSADTRFLINEIVVGEESDVDADGNRKSHFEIYLDAMTQSGADVCAIQKFTSTLHANGGNLDQALNSTTIPPAAKAFVENTFRIINSQKTHATAAAFTFGREDLIPGMFHSLINDINQNFPNSIAVLKYYLERHIEVDGDHHSHLALAMTEQLCGNDEKKWSEATAETVASLQSRIKLWDGVYEEIISRKN